MVLKFFFSLLLAPCLVHSLDVLNDDEVLGLIVFKAGLQDPDSKLSTWNENNDSPCNWAGIKCDPKSNRVTELTLDGFSLSGQISRGLLRLQSLRRLSLSNNKLSGSINPEFSHLWSLQSIDLSGNSLSGSVPNELFQQCGSLKFVSFANNDLSGEIPGSLSSCMSLETVNFSSNSLSGRLPDKIWSLGGLKSLDLSDNSLEGEIPKGIGGMYSLQVLGLGKNAFSGDLPDDIGDCLRLQSVDFRWNSFSGGIPESMQKLNTCTSLSLNGNLLSGEIPDGIGEMHSLQNLDLSANRFLGRIPNSLGSLHSLRELNLSSNGFEGDFSATIEFLSPNSILKVLDLSSNALSGVIPSRISELSNLFYLNLSSNSLFGAIPSRIGELNGVEVIDLSSNRLNGSIPLEIGGADSLRELRLEKNYLSGGIPYQIADCTPLTTLVVSENNLTGAIPEALTKLANLETVDLSQNNLSGDLPRGLTNLSHLLSFNISNNRLEGELPDNSFFNTIPLSSVSGNPSLCGSIVNKTCPAVHPKPIVLNPNPPSDTLNDSLPPNLLHHKDLVLSISSIIAVGAAALIFLGVVAITILNLHVRYRSSRSSPPHTFSGKEELSHSPVSDSEYGRLVMFSGEADFGTEAQGLLTKDSEIGRGGFGAVYHTVTKNGLSVAIKKLSISSLIKSQQDFEREVGILGKVRHQNLVAVEGYYWSSSLQLLINEYTPGGSLFKHLHGDSSSGSSCLTWHQRLSVIFGMAKGLAHLHKMNIIHYNLKSTNVLLDSGCEAKVGDFGLVRLLPVLDRCILSSKVQSALGYMAPEFGCRTVKITEKSDVYGFGVLVLEIVTGKKPVEYMEDDVIVLCEVIRGALEEGRIEDCIDKRLQGNFKADEVIPVIKLGLICVSQVPSNRPDMAEVVDILEVIRCPSEGREELE